MRGALRWVKTEGVCRWIPGIAFLAALSFPSGAAGLPEKIDFNHHIKPLLSDRCFACHGPDERARKADLRLDLPEGAFKTLADGWAVIKAGDPSRSELIRRITAVDPTDKMPPPRSNLTLSAEEQELLRRWVGQGAEWKRHWSFIPLEPVRVPEVTNAAWVKNEIDRFVLARLEREGLTPKPPARKEHLIRRVTLDLTGLPPSLDEVDQFLGDASPQAYERLVDRLLAVPAFGERMAADWLDVARYADTHGYQADRYNHLWPWRDWVIQAFNRNLPFDDFILWQIAGDLLPNATRDQKLATAFNRNHRQTNEGGSVEEEFRVEYVADRVHTTAGAFLGLTMECARCHDHKFDPISQKDYYRLFAFFNSTDESGLYSHFTDAIPSPTLLLYENDAQEREHRELQRKIASLEQTLANRRQEAGPAFADWLQTERQLPGIDGWVGYYSFDEVVSNSVPNLAGTNGPARLTDQPRSVPGKLGQALEFSGENSATIEKVANFKRTDPFSFSLWLRIPETLPEIVVLHHQQAGSDAAYHGYQLVLEDGYASFALVHFWPGNALKVRTRDKLPLHEWLHLGISYDGSSKARGLRLYVNGQPAATEVVRDQLFKDFANGGPLTLAARFRGRGFKDGHVDELKIYNRCLTALEMHADYAGWKPGVSLPQPQDPDEPVKFAWFEYYLAHFDPVTINLERELRQLRDAENKLVNSVREIMVMGDLPTPRPSFGLKRGMYDAPGERVEPGAPEAILPFSPDLPKNRLGLARWLLDRRNPLTARVIVNRYWQLFFGKGIVETAENFGSQGTLPTHPELLDWLAQWFMDHGWNLKELCKQIVTSASYCQVSAAGPELLAMDPDNRLLACGPKNRLTAEMLRDQALAAAGLLVENVGGPSVKPYQPEGLWEEKSAGWRYEPDRGAALYRRSLYTYWKRTVPHPAMTTFDAAERNNCTLRRQATSTPLQALVLLNDPQFVEAARKIAERARREGGATPEARIRYTFRLLTSREPQNREMAVLKQLYQDQLNHFAAHREAIDELASVGSTPWTPGGDLAELAAGTAVANALLNYDEAVYKR